MPSEPKLLAAALALAAAPALAAQTDAWQTSLPPAHVRMADEAKSALRQGDAEAAEQRYRELLAVEPDYYRAQYNLGLALLAQGENEAAAAALERAVEIRAKLGLDEPTVFNSLGWAWFLAGNLEKAEAAYLEGVKLAASNSRGSNQRLFNNLGSLYLRQGRLEEAEKALLRARDEFGSAQAEANLEMVRSLRASERYRKASEQLVVKPADRN
jgi:Flp pilus assembly protein TadD